MPDRRDEVPEDFSYREQLEEITSIYNTKRDFIEGKTRKRVMGDEERNLLTYNLARIKAIGKTIRALYEAEKAGGAPAPKPEPPAAPVKRDDEF